MVVVPVAELLLGEGLLVGSRDLDLDLLVVVVPVTELLLGEYLLSGSGDLDPTLSFSLENVFCQAMGILISTSCL